MVRLANFPAVRWSLTSFSINYNSLFPEPTPRRNKTLRQFVDSALYTCFSDHFRPFFGDSETRVREIHARASFVCGGAQTMEQSMLCCSSMGKCLS